MRASTWWQACYRLLPGRGLLFDCIVMTNELVTALNRIERALARIEHVATLPIPAKQNDESERRYQRLRTRTQAALAELDSVIARVAQSEHA